MQNQKQEYLKVRITEAERGALRKMIQKGQASTMSGAIRVRAFSDHELMEDADLIARLMSDLASLHGELSLLIREPLAGKTLYEGDLMRMEQLIQDYGKHLVLLSQTIRRRLSHGNSGTAHPH